MKKAHAAAVLMSDPEKLKRLQAVLERGDKPDTPLGVIPGSI